MESCKFISVTILYNLVVLHYFLWIIQLALSVWKYKGNYKSKDSKVLGDNTIGSTLLFFFCLLLSQLPSKPAYTFLWYLVLAWQLLVTELPLCTIVESEVFEKKKIKPIEIQYQLMYDKLCIDVKNVCKWCREFSVGYPENHDRKYDNRHYRPPINKNFLHLIHCATTQTQEGERGWELTSSSNNDCSNITSGSDVVLFADVWFQQ